MDEQAYIRRCRSCGWPGLVWTGVNPGRGKQAEGQCRICGETGTIYGTLAAVRCRFRSAEEIGTDMPIPGATD
jgi:ribosomal protein S14